MTLKCMKLRMDLLKLVTPEDVIEMGLLMRHRFSAEPVFSKTVSGHLLPTSTADSARELRQLTEFQAKLTMRSKQSGKRIVASK